MKKLIAILLVLMMILSLTACKSTTDSTSNTSSTSTDNSAGANPTTGANTTSASDFDGCLNVGIPGDPADLSPFSTMSVGRMYVMETVYEFLGVYKEKNGDFVGQLAKTIDVSDDALTVTVTLYDNITDSAGNKITADDVLFSYNTAIEKKTSVQLGYVDNIEKKDDYTVIFHMNSAIVQGWQAVMSAIPIVSQKAYEANPDGFALNPVTTSAYKVSSFTAGSSLKLDLRDDYWQTDDNALAIQHNVDSIEFDVILDSAQMAIALETGAIDVAEGMATADTARFMEGGEDADNYSVFTTDDTRSYCLLFNCDETQGVFANNKELRQAIAYAIDAQGLLDAVLNGGGVLESTWGGASADDFDPSWVSDYYSYNVDKAKELLKEAGYKEGELTLRLACTNDKTISSSLELIQSYLMAIGINSTINVVDSGLFDTVKYDPSEWDILMDSIGGADVALVSKNLDTTGKSYINVCFVKDDTLQNLVQTIMAVPTHTSENVKKYVDYINDQVYAYGLFNKNSYIVAPKFVDSITFTSRSCIYPGDTVVK